MEMKNAQWPALAPLFHYYVVRYQRGIIATNGALPLDATTLNPLGVEGICRLDTHDMPFAEEGSRTRPSDAATADARTHRIGRSGTGYNYQPIRTPSRAMGIRAALLANYPVVIGFALPDGYPDAFVDSKFAWTDPTDPAPGRGGHCVVIIGFSDARSAFHIHDSQGADRFDHGRWWMGYQVADSDVVSAAVALT